MTDIFIKRPVLSIVVSLILLVLGLRAAISLPVREFPATQSANISVTTIYYGADPDVIAGFITAPIENAVAQADGIDYVTSSSDSGVSSVTAHLRLNYDYNKAMTEISTKVNSVLNRLPPQSQQPIITLETGQATPSMYLSFRSNVLAQNQMSDYLVRIVQPELQAVPGVQKVQIFGQRTFAMRVWLNPDKLAAYGLTAADVNQALSVNDFISGIGATKGQMVAVSLNASTGLHTVEEFRNLAIKQVGNTIVRLQDVANVVLGAEDYDSIVVNNGQHAIVMALEAAPDANVLDVTAGIQKVFPSIKAHLPAGMEAEIVFDASKFVNSSIHEVEMTILAALLIVMGVVFAFLGSPRAVFIPVVAIPLSLIGTFIMMFALGYSINLLTLLAMVLAIGLVVDDAIIVVENVYRHMKEGMNAFSAAILGARELSGPIIAMTVVLMAVYVPVAFQSGLTGALFTEFAFTLIGTVTISAIVALTLSPMLCSRLLRPHGEGRDWEVRLTGFIDRTFDKTHAWYERRLHNSLDFRSVTLTLAVIMFGATIVLWMFSQSELAPEEDQGFILAAGQTAPNATLQQNQIYVDAVGQITTHYPEFENSFQVAFPGGFFIGMVLTPWNERSRSAKELANAATAEIAQVPGIRAAMFSPPSLPGGGGGLPVEIVITTSDSFDRLNEVVNHFMEEIDKAGLFWYSQSDLKIDRPQATLEIDRDKAAAMGISMADIGAPLASMLSGGYTNYYVQGGRSYRVMAQAEQRFRLNPQQLLDQYIHTPSGKLVQVGSFAHVVTRTIPESLPHFQQLNAATIGGVPKGTQGDALAALKAIADRTLPDGYLVDYSGQSRQYMQESGSFVITLALAAIIIFLALAALFESFRDPAIILFAVPLSIAGALAFIHMGIGGATLNIYTKIGILTLAGLISKHGILIVDVANRLQREGHTKREAVEIASGMRLRPILMTTAAMVLGVVPLLFASGAGAAARFNMGLVVASGLSIGTLFTLFVVPAAYTLFAEDHHKLRERQEAQEALISEHEPAE